MAGENTTQDVEAGLTADQALDLAKKVDELAKALDQLFGKVGILDTLAEALGSIDAALEKIRGSAAGFADLLVNELEKIRSKAAAANAELSKITGRGGPEEAP